MTHKHDCRRKPYRIISPLLQSERAELLQIAAYVWFSYSGMMADLYQHPVFFECESLKKEHLTRLQNYFRNRRKSGGGDCGQLTRVDANVYSVVFQNKKGKFIMPFNISKYSIFIIKIYILYLYIINRFIYARNILFIIIIISRLK